MSPAFDPMTFDELSELYRVEMKSASLTQVRKDLFKAMASLITALRQDYDRQMSIDPDSVMTEGAEQRRKKAERLCKDIVVLRTRKISSMAIRGAEGAKNTLECLADDERAYYDSLLELTKRQLSEVDRLRGKRTTVATRIDEEPVRDARPKEESAAEPVEAVHEAPRPADVPPDAFDEPVPDEPFPEEPFYTMDEPFDEGPAEIFEEPPATPEPEPTVHHETEEPPVTEEQSTEILRILEDLPEFAGPDRNYKLSKEDLIVLPKVLADALVNTGKATVIRPTP